MAHFNVPFVPLATTEQGRREGDNAPRRLRFHVLAESERRRRTGLAKRVAYKGTLCPLLPPFSLALLQRAMQSGKLPPAHTKHLAY